MHCKIKVEDVLNIDYSKTGKLQKCGIDEEKALELGSAIADFKELTNLPKIFEMIFLDTDSNLATKLYALLLTGAVLGSIRTRLKITTELEKENSK